jgi:hypothetical protein
MDIDHELSTMHTSLVDLVNKIIVDEKEINAVIRNHMADIYQSLFIKSNLVTDQRGQRRGVFLWF